MYLITIKVKKKRRPFIIETPSTEKFYKEFRNESAILIYGQLIIPKTNISYVVIDEIRKKIKKES